MAIPNKVFITIDFTPLSSLKDEYKKHARNMLSELGEYHAAQLTRRFIAFSLGQGYWARLSEKTLRKKRWEMNKYGWSGSAQWILRRSSRMSQSIGFRIMPRLNGYFAGFVNEQLQYSRPKYTKRSVVQLANIHHFGLGRVPRRPVVDEPNNRERARMISIANKHFGKVIRGANMNVRSMRVNP